MIKYTYRKGETRIVEDVNLKIIDSRKCFWLLTCWEYEAVFRTQNRKLDGQLDDVIPLTAINQKEKCLMNEKNGTAPPVCLEQVSIASETQFSFLVSLKDLFFFFSKKLYLFIYFWPCHTGIEPRPWKYKRGVPTTGSSGKSQRSLPLKKIKFSRWRYFLGHSEDCAPAGGQNQRKSGPFSLFPSSQVPQQLAPLG